MAAANADFDAVALALHRTPQRVNPLENLQGRNRWSLGYTPLRSRDTPNIQSRNSFTIIGKLNGDGLFLVIQEVPRFEHRRFCISRLPARL